MWLVNKIFIICRMGSSSTWCSICISQRKPFFNWLIFNNYNIHFIIIILKVTFFYLHVNINFCLYLNFLEPLAPPHFPAGLLSSLGQIGSSGNSSPPPSCSPTHVGPSSMQLSSAGLQQLNSASGLQHIALTNLQQLQQLSLSPQLALQLSGQIGAGGPIGGPLGGLPAMPTANNGINNIPILLREGQRMSRLYMHTA